MITRPVLRRGLAVSFVGLALAGCNSWIAHRETISLQAGDAVAWNKAVHTIDPWPAASRDTTIPTSGRRLARVIDAYENGTQGQPAGGAGGFAPLAPMAPAAGMAPGGTP